MKRVVLYDLTDLGNQNDGLRSLLGLSVLAIMVSIFLFTAKVGGYCLRKPGPSGAKFQPPSIGSRIRTRGGPNKNTGKTYSKRWQDKYFFLCLNNWALACSELFKNCGQLVSCFLWAVFSLEQCLVWSPWPSLGVAVTVALGFAPKNAHVRNTRCSGPQTLFWQITLLSFPVPCL